MSAAHIVAGCTRATREEAKGWRLHSQWPCQPWESHRRFCLLNVHLHCSAFTWSLSAYYYLVTLHILSVLFLIASGHAGSTPLRFQSCTSLLGLDTIVPGKRSPITKNNCLNEEGARTICDKKLAETHPAHMATLSRTWLKCIWGCYTCCSELTEVFQV